MHPGLSLRLPFGEGLPAPASAVQNALGEGCASLHQIEYRTKHPVNAREPRLRAACRPMRSPVLGRKPPVSGSSSVCPYHVMRLWEVTMAASDDDSGTPLGQKLRRLRGAISEAADWATQEVLRREEHRIEGIIISRNLQGIEHEKARRIAKAVELYEANVTDRIDGSHPYERLRVIYTREGKLEDAIRICEAYIQFGQGRDSSGKEKCRKTIEKLKRMISERRVVG